MAAYAIRTMGRSGCRFPVDAPRGAAFLARVVSGTTAPDGSRGGARQAVRSRLRRHNLRRARRGRGALRQPRGAGGRLPLGFIVTFATPQARDADLNDPNHRPVAEAIGAAAERIVVFDI